MGDGEEVVEDDESFSSVEESLSASRCIVAAHLYMCAVRCEAEVKCPFWVLPSSPQWGAWLEREVCDIVGKKAVLAFLRGGFSGGAVDVITAAISGRGISFARVVGCCRG